MDSVENERLRLEERCSRFYRSRRSRVEELTDELTDYEEFSDKKLKGG